MLVIEQKLSSEQDNTAALKTCAHQNDYCIKFLICYLLIVGKVDVGLGLRDIEQDHTL